MAAQGGVPVIDSDLHCEVPSIETLVPYLSDYWQEQIRQTGFKGPVDAAYPASAQLSARPDTATSGTSRDADLLSLRSQVLDPLHISYAILTCAYAVDSLHNPYAAAALASAVNDWQCAAWLDQEPRLRGSLLIPSQDTDLAVAEIERLGTHPSIVQVLLPARSAAPYGNRRFHPIYAAATHHDLVVGIQFGGAPGNPPTPVGWPSFYLEEYAGMASVFQSHLLSLVSEGVFDRFPSLRVALIESGCTWLPSLLWRFDKEWKGLRREIPWVRQPPSTYIREHVRLTLAPFDAPPDPQYVLQFVDQVGSEDLLMFATDYPHWHDDTLPDAHLDGLPAALRQKMLYDNARTLYRL